MLNGISHLTQFRVYVTKPASFNLPGANDSIAITEPLDTVRATVPLTPSTELELMLQQVPDQIALAIVTNEDLLPRNPHLATQIQAKLALLRTPGLASRIANLSFFVDRTVRSANGRDLPIIAVFTADSMRAGAE